MHKALIYILAMMMALTACSSSDTTEEPQPGQQKPNMLTIYVYSPENPVLTRGDVGEVDATSEESIVKGLKIWVYETQSGKMVGYLDTNETATLNLSQGAVYQIPVDDDFAQRKPNVDVYVVANVTAANCGITAAFTKESTWDYVRDNAKIEEAYFGLPQPGKTTALTTSVPSDGLPMSGELTSQPVVGDAPVLRIGTTSQIATVTLTRAVSKLRFVFSNTSGADDLSIRKITLKEGMIPNVEYLFTNSQQLSYNSAVAELLPNVINPVNTTDKPADYVYNSGTQTAQDYEDLIATGITANKLTPVGPIYLRESARRLEGTITYQVGNKIGTEEVSTATFRMTEAGDFKRNHSWIVYAYFEGLNGMQVVTVDVKPWVPTSGSHTVYNW